MKLFKNPQWLLNELEKIPNMRANDAFKDGIVHGAELVFARLEESKKDDNQDNPDSWYNEARQSVRREIYSLEDELDELAEKNAREKYGDRD